jgi:glucose-1-phosphate thymidylyltransferase
MKGIILAGWSWTRLYPVTQAISKQLMPIYDKPMIYYPISTLLIAWIKEILIITTPEDNESFKRLLWNWSKWGIKLEYAIQPSPDGLAQAFIIWEDFIWNDDVCLVLWDNLFYGQGLSDLLKNSVNIVEKEKKSVVFWYEVADPERYWVVDFDENMNAISIEEKPKDPKSSFAVIWLYFYTNDVVKIAKKVKPSERWELEITSINEVFLNNWELKVELMNRWYAWLDTWTHESMLEASNFIQIIEKRQGLKISCIEEIVWKNWYIDDKQLAKLAQPLKKNNYWKYLLKLISKNV